MIALLLSLLVTICSSYASAAVNTTNATLFDASPAQRRGAFANVSVPVTNLTTPTLRNVSNITPNATLVYKNVSQGTAESSGAFDYATALQLSFQYFAAERLGALPAGYEIPWRASAFEDDPVPGGFGDAGDWLLCHLPLAQTLALMANSVIEFPEAYTASSNLDAALDTLRTGLEFFIASRTSDVDTVVSPVS